MQSHSLSALFVALLLCVQPAVATFGLFGYFNCITNWNWNSHGGHHNKPVTTTADATATANCAVPSIVVADRQKRDTDDDVIVLNERTFGQFYPKAALGVSKVIRKTDELFEVVCDFKLANSAYYKGLIPNNRVKNFGFSNTGCGSDFHVIKDSSCAVSSWVEWSTSIVVKPERQNGKCCLPDGLSLDIEFEYDSSVYMRAWKSVFQKQFSWKVESSSAPSFSAVDDWNSFFSFSASKRDSKLLPENILNRGESQQKKRFLSFWSYCDTFSKFACKKPTFDKFCWDCSCNDPVSSSSVPSSTECTTSTSSTDCTTSTSSTDCTTSTSSTDCTTSTSSTDCTTSTSPTLTSSTKSTTSTLSTLTSSTKRKSSTSSTSISSTSSTSISSTSSTSISSTKCTTSTSSTTTECTTVTTPPQPTTTPCTTGTAVPSPTSTTCTTDGNGKSHGWAWNWHSGWHFW